MTLQERLERYCRSLGYMYDGHEVDETRDVVVVYTWGPRTVFQMTMEAIEDMEVPSDS